MISDDRKSWRIHLTFIYIIDSCKYCGKYCLHCWYLHFLNRPVLVVTTYHQEVHRNLSSYNYYSWAETDELLNSCLNSLVCCWRARNLRKAIVKEITPWVPWVISISYLLALIVKIARKNGGEIRSRMVKHVDQQKRIQIIQKRNLGFGNDKWMKQRTYFRGKAVREIWQY